jgi:protein TonB
MRCADILLSVLFHAGLAAGIIYGLPQVSSTEADGISIEPIFFEILEESTIAPPSAKEISGGSVPTSIPTSIPTAFEGSVPSFEGSVPMHAAMSLPVSVAEPPSIGLEPCSAEVEDPVHLPPLSKTPKESAEGDVPEKEEGSAPSALQERSRVVSEPRALNRIVPVYPRSARRRGREGVVTVEITVSDFGEVSGVEVIAGSGYKDLDSAAVSAVRTAHFSPAIENGVRVQGSLRLTFEFKLR